MARLLGRQRGVGRGGLQQRHRRDSDGLRGRAAQVELRQHVQRRRLDARVQAHGHAVPAEPLCDRAWAQKCTASS